MRAQETTAYPLHWPLGFARTPAHRRQRARFSSRGDYSSKPLTIAQGRDRVLDELSRMTPVGQTWRVAGIVISTNLRTRTDGLPYSNARTPDDPGVATYFNLDGQPHCLPCDQWDRVADNLAAIAAHLRAMRGMERWGVGDLNRIFAGFQALPDPVSAGAEHWSQVLCVSADDTPETIKAAYLCARKAAHPDAGGTVDAFHRVQRAWEQFRQERMAG